MKDFLMFGEDRSIYNEIPVDIDTFIEDDYYLGKATNNGKNIFPFWRSTLYSMFHIEEINNYDEMFLATATNTGKTKISILAFTYVLYCYMCLKNPNTFFKFSQDSKLAFMICDSSSEIKEAKNIFLNYIKTSGWFARHGEFIYKKDIHDISFLHCYKPFNNIEIIYACNCDDIYGVQIVCTYFHYNTYRTDRCSTLKFYNSIDARIKSRTIKEGKYYGKLITDLELTNEEVNIQLVNEKRKSMNVCFISGSQFQIKPLKTFNWSKSFIITYDGIYGHSKVITKEDIILGERQEKEYKVIECPISLLNAAKLDPDTFLLMICGIQLSIKHKPIQGIDILKDLFSGKPIMQKNSMLFYKFHKENDHYVISAYRTDHDNSKEKDILSVDCSVALFISKLLNCNDWVSYDIE